MLRLIRILLVYRSHPGIVHIQLREVKRTSRRMLMLRLGVRMRVRAASTAVRTAVDTRVKEPRAWPSRLAATDSASLRVMMTTAR